MLQFNYLEGFFIHLRTPTEQQDFSRTCFSEQHFTSVRRRKIFRYGRSKTWNDCLAEAPNKSGRSPRLPCATIRSRALTVYLNQEIVGGFRAIARKIMSASKPSYEIKKQGRCAELVYGNQSLSARDSHYSDRRDFCNTYFTFLLVQIKLRESISFYCDCWWVQTTLLREDRWSHHL